MTREQALNFLLNHPARFGHMLGFTKLGDMHNQWIIDMVRGREDQTLQAHRGSFKTTCVSIALALIVILLPNLTTAFIRKTGGDVVEIMKQVQKILMDEHTLYFVKVIYGVELHFTVLNQGTISTNLVTSNKGTSQLIGLGTQSSITGKHYDRIFTDDIVNLQDRIFRSERERIKGFYQELHNIKNVGGRIFNTGTPWHPDDCFQLMPNPVKYDCYSTGLLTEEDIEDLKEKMTSSLFCANYELKHVSDEDIIFSNPQMGADPSLAEQGYTHVDAAFYGEDYTAFTAVNIHDGKWYVYGRVWRRHIDDCEDEIESLHKAFKATAMYNELNADKGLVAKELRKRGIKVLTYTESMNKYIKITSYLKFDWKNVIFVAGTDEEYIDMICDYNENAEHDDAPDSLSSLMRALWNRKNKKPVDTTSLMFM